MRIIITLTLTMIVIAGCKSATEKQFEREQIIIGPPLEHDPTDRVEIARWWSNGTHLLRLDDNAAYALYQGTNRFAQPIERGRWGKQSYAFIRLEPYNTSTVDPRRVGISKIDGKLALSFPESATKAGARMEPLFALRDAPAVLEDRMIGWWQGSFGRLHLRDDLRYALMPNPDGDAPDGEVDRRRAYGKGGWRVAENTLILHSDIPGIDPLRLPLIVEDKQITITAPGGAMGKVQSGA